VNASIALLPGDGVGPEVVDAAVTVLTRVGRVFSHGWTFQRELIGGAALRAGQEPLPARTLAACLAADAVLLGAVGDPAFDSAPPGRRPESSLLTLRQEMGVYANLRPARAWSALRDAGPLRPEVLAGTDLVVVRELTGGLYYGEPRGLSEDGQSAVNTLRYTQPEIERVAHVAFTLARARRRKLVSVDKANVLEVSRLWRSVVTAVGRDFPDVALSHEYVDAAAMKLTLTPAAFDVMLTENMFGDILSDEAGAVCGSLGLLPSASLGDGPGLFEPVHGSAPDLAGRNVANPIGAICSAAMLLSDGLDLRDEGAAMISAVEAVLADGLRTPDLAAAEEPRVGTAEFAGAVADRIG